LRGENRRFFVIYWNEKKCPPLAEKRKRRERRLAMKKQIACFTVAAAFISTSLGAVSVTSVSGPAQHGKVLTISGSGFGQKSPAAPMVWDDCSDNSSLSKHYHSWQPTNASKSEYNFQYHPTSFRSVGGPHNRAGYMLGGAHGGSQTDYSSGYNVMFGVPLSSHRYYLSYYYRVDPRYDEENSSNYDNMKELVISNNVGSFYPDAYGSFT